LAAFFFLAFGRFLFPLAFALPPYFVSVGGKPSGNALLPPAYKQNMRQL
jgi:hypothetical protein